MQCNDTSNQGAQVNHHVHVIVLHQHASHQLLHIQVGQQINNRLHVGDNLRVGLHSPLRHGRQVILHLDQLLRERGQSRHLRLHKVRHGGHGRIVDIPQQVLHPHLLGLHRADQGRHVRERLAHLRGPSGRFIVPNPPAGDVRIDLLHDAIRRGGDALPSRPDVDDDEHRRSDRIRRHEPSNELVDPQVVRTDLRTGGVESHDAFLRVDLSGHGEHVLEVIVIEVEHGRVFGILLEGDGEGVGGVDAAAGGRAEEDSDGAFASAAGDAVVVIRRREED
mmetsp:Transcript_25519/g.61366  ORF Transcript_25519/g.61366 Transcript_25519/m.61366 type:complete len:278 (+) Transcript_25519:442-1275(+)